MGKQLVINKFYIVKNGILCGVEGKLVAYNALENEATIKVDQHASIITKSENLELTD